MKIWIPILIAASASSASAQVCGENSLQESLQYLRRLSLDLRGRVPDMAELESVVANNGAIDPSIIRSIVRSEAMITQIHQHHRDLLWTNITDQRIVDQSWTLANIQRPAGVTGDIVLQTTSQTRRRAYRGGNVPCLDEAARFDANGNILTTVDPVDPAIRREGWVLIRPYWNPAVQVKVCAFDAQDELQAMNSANRMVDCRTQTAVKGCGCGPDLQWCQSVPDRTSTIITAALGEQMLRFMDSVVRDGRPYTDVITARDIEVNGPISHYLRFQTNSGMGSLFGSADTDYVVPVVPFSEATRWVSANREATHAGVLTMPGYLIKFQSDRGRANRFYNAFLCQAFQAPAGGLPAADDACNLEPDLTKRCGCKHCHIAVEPAAAYWGRWSEAGFAPLDETNFPGFNPACAAANAGSNANCRRFYMIAPGHPDEVPFRGYLRSLVFADTERQENIRNGPRALAQTAIDNGAFASCVTKQMFERLMAREPNELDQEMLGELESTLVGTNYDLRALIESIVKRPEYAEAGRFDAKEHGR